MRERTSFRDCLKCPPATPKGYGSRFVCQLTVVPTVVVFLPAAAVMPARQPLSCARRCRWIIRLCAIDGRNCIGAQRLAQGTPEQHSRIVGATGIAILAIDVARVGGRMRILAFFALLTSQQLAQKYPFTIDTLIGCAAVSILP